MRKIVERRHGNGRKILKRDLAVVYRADREAYTDAKAAFVEEILTKTKRGSD